MGLGYRPSKACVVSSFRLQARNRREQFLKVLLHEIGHTYGLPTAPYPAASCATQMSIPHFTRRKIIVGFKEKYLD